MSYDISLCDDAGRPVRVAPFEDGGTYVLGGSDEAELNVTYNYAGLFGFRDLHARRASDTIPELREAVQRLGTERDADYWKPTLGNAGAACARLLVWAEQHPHASWSVS